MCYNDYVMGNGSNYATAYFEIGSVRVFGLPGTNTVVNGGSNTTSTTTVTGSSGSATSSQSSSSAAWSLGMDGRWTMMLAIMLVLGLGGAAVLV